jgi:poly[(R)-3-hydroxyalkanoate] polymerase subunit PhaE
MSNSKSPQEWMQDWQTMQRQYWTNWSDATRQMTGQPPEPSTPWAEGLEQWSRMFGDSGKQNETVERLLGSSKGYLALMQSMLAAASGKNIDAGPMQAWTDALRNGFNMFGTSMSGSSMSGTNMPGTNMPGMGMPGMDANMFDNPMAMMMRGISGKGAHGFEQLSGSFAPFLAQAQQQGMSWLQMPAFGYAREHQEHYQKTMVAFVEYQEAVKKYNMLILKSSQRGFEIFESKLGERSEPGRQIDSLRAFYDLWVDAAEEAYAEIALSDEFRKVYGDVVNAQTRVRSQIQLEVERIGTDLGMPTRKELNSVHKTLHELRRIVRDLPSADSAAEIEQLREEVKTLKQALGRKDERKSTPLKPVVATTSKPKAPAVRVRKAAPVQRRAVAVAKPLIVAKHGSSFSEAIDAMRGVVSVKPKKDKSKKKKKSAKAVASVSVKHTKISPIVRQRKSFQIKSVQIKSIRSKT